MIGSKAKTSNSGTSTPATLGGPGRLDAGRPTPAPDALRVLVVDNHAGARRVVELILETIGATMVMAQNGLEAVDARSKLTFDVVLMDPQMPVMGGLEAMRRIRAGEDARGRPRVPNVCSVRAPCPSIWRLPRRPGGPPRQAGQAQILIAAVLNACGAPLTAQVA